jgi:uncharacterized protein (TIRG00374 family)
MAKKILNWRTLTGIAISLIGLYLGFRKFDNQAFLDVIRKTDLLIFLASMAVMVLMVILRAWRWQTLLQPMLPVTLDQTFGTEMVGFFGNNVFPFRLGEVLRAYALANLKQTSTVAVFGSIVSERLLDTLMFVIILLAGAIFFPQLPPIIRISAAAATVLILILIVLSYILLMNKKQFKALLKRKIELERKPRLQRLFSNFWRGLNTLRQTPQLGLITLQSLLIWFVCVLNTWISGRALGVNFDISTLLLVFFVTNAAISIPSAPGYVGTYHAATIGALVLWGYPLAQAQALAVILHAVGFLTLTTIGFGYFLKYHLNYRQAKLAYTQKGAGQ